MTETMTRTLTPPPGFTPLDFTGGFTVLTGPFYERHLDDKRMTVGMHIAQKHLHGGGTMHGGMLQMLVDTAMTRATWRMLSDDQRCVTATLSSEFIGIGQPGDWIEAEVELLKLGRRVAFLNCLVRRDGADGELLLRASATFHIAPRKA